LTRRGNRISIGWRPLWRWRCSILACSRFVRLVDTPRQMLTESRLRRLLLYGRHLRDLRVECCRCPKLWVGLRAAPPLTCNAGLRNIMGGCLPLAAPAIYGHLSYPVAGTVLASMQVRIAEALPPLIRAQVRFLRTCALRPLLLRRTNPIMVEGCDAHWASRDCGRGRGPPREGRREGVIEDGDIGRCCASEAAMISMIGTDPRRRGVTNVQHENGPRWQWP
jgi:hypothetical protein